MLASKAARAAWTADDAEEETPGGAACVCTIGAAPPAGPRPLITWIPSEVRLILPGRPTGLGPADVTSEPSAAVGGPCALVPSCVPPERKPKVLILGGAAIAAGAGAAGGAGVLLGGVGVAGSGARSPLGGGGNPGIVCAAEGGTARAAGGGGMGGGGMAGGGMAGGGMAGGGMAGGGMAGGGMAGGGMGAREPGAAPGGGYPMGIAGGYGIGG